MSVTVVRYRPKPEQAEENQALVEAVFTELATTAPAGLNYTTFRLADGTFVHIAEIQGERNPLLDVTAFNEFARGVGDRCEPEARPNPQSATVVGVYRSKVGSADQ
jgi:hypothetical protein